MAVPESFAGIVGIFFLIGLGVMADMVPAPLEGGILQSPAASDEDAALDPIRAFEALVGDQPVVADGDPHARDDVHHEGQNPIEEAESVVVAIERDADDGGGDDGAKQRKI